MSRIEDVVLFENGQIAMRGFINHSYQIHESETARSVTINYRDGSSYTIKTKGNVRIIGLNGKSERKLEIMYDREPVTVKSTDDFTVKEVGSVTESVTLRQKDVKSISVRELGRTTTLNKFDQSNLNRWI